MTCSGIKERHHVDAHLVLSVTLKLLGIYLLFSALSQSGYLLDAMISASAAMTSGSSPAMWQWGQVASSLTATVMSAGLAIILIRHGTRAAHWLSVSSDLQVPTVSPTRQWFRGALAIIGIWLLATRVLSASHTLIQYALSAFDTSPMGEVFGSAAYGGLALLDLLLSLAVGLTLIFAAPRLGDWLYRVSKAAANPASESEAP